MPGDSDKTFCVGMDPREVANHHEVTFPSRVWHIAGEASGVSS